jgi:trk system potassium uptake protein TrkH
MRISLILDALGLVLIYIGVLLLLPILVAIVYQEWSAIIAFGTAAAIGIITGFILKKVTPKYDELHRTEGITIVAFSWAIAAILGAIPYMFYNLNIIDAMFESMSGITTTGATILKDFSLYPKALFFWRSFSQWLGGMGIIVLFIAILPQFAVAGRQLFFAEAPGPTEEKLTPRIRHTAKNLWALYIALTIIEILLLSYFGMPVYDAICNSLSTLAAGGFSPNPQSIMGYNSPVLEWIIIVFMFLAGANFALQFRVIRSQKPMLLAKNSEFMTYSIIFLAATILLTLILVIETHFSIFTSLRVSAFQVISILTTTGFATADFAQWSDPALIILIALMFVGGSAGSSGGGIKVVRVLLLIKSAFREVLQLIHPKAVLPLKLDKQIVSSEVMRQITVFFVFYMLILLISTIIVTALENSITIGFTSSAATLGNIGPGLGLVGPMGHYADITPITKVILTINMWVGRLEIMTVLILLSPFTWKHLVRK